MAFIKSLAAVFTLRSPREAGGNGMTNDALAFRRVSRLASRRRWQVKASTLMGNPRDGTFTALASGDAFLVMLACLSEDRDEDGAHAHFALAVICETTERRAASTCRLVSFRPPRAWIVSRPHHTATV
jgi:hypothetical protein